MITLFTNFKVVIFKIYVPVDLVKHVMLVVSVSDAAKQTHIVVIKSSVNNPSCCEQSDFMPHMAGVAGHSEQ